MLKPSEVNARAFERGTFGYRPEDIDPFLEQVARDYEVLYNNNLDSEEKIMKLVDKINEYREDEEAIKDALLSAQKESKRVLAEAKQQAEKMLEEATAKREQIERESEAECERIIAEHKEYCAKVISENTAETEKKIAQVKNEYARQSKQLRELRLSAAQFKAELTEIYSQQIQLVMDMPDDTDVDLAPEEEEPATAAVNEAAAEQESAPAEESAESLINSEPESTEEKKPQQDIPALKDESVFNKDKPREVKFSDLRFGNKK